MFHFFCHHLFWISPACRSICLPRVAGRPTCVAGAGPFVRHVSQDVQPATLCAPSGSFLSQVRSQNVAGPWHFLSQVPEMWGDLRRYMHCVAISRRRSLAKTRTCDAGRPTCDDVRVCITQLGYTEGIGETGLCTSMGK